MYLFKISPLDSYSPQLVPLYGHGLPAKCLPNVAQEVSRGEETVASEATVEANKGRSTFRVPKEGRPGRATVLGKARRDTCIS